MWHLSPTTAHVPVVLLLRAQQSRPRSRLADGQSSGECDDARGVQVNEKCDVYALGVMLWECLTGTRPFAGMMPVQVMHQMIARQRKGEDWLPFPRQCPEKVANLIRRCWHAEKMQRISSEEVRWSSLGARGGSLLRAALLCEPRLLSAFVRAPHCLGLTPLGCVRGTVAPKRLTICRARRL